MRRLQWMPVTARASGGHEGGVSIYLLRGDGLRPVASPAGVRRIRWAAWHPDGGHVLLVGNRGQAFRFEPDAGFAALPQAGTQNVRGVAWSPDGRRALLAGNLGAVALYDGERVRELPRVTSENLRRVAWSPDGAAALVVGNAGVVLRFDGRTEELLPLPGDRAHTMRSVAWRPDGAYALIGAYASAHAGYPRSHVLYRCDGRYTQALLATDDADDAVAVEWRPGAEPPRATALVVANPEDAGGRVTNKIVEYDGAGFRYRVLKAPGVLIGMGWRPDGAHALVCGEAGVLLRYDGAEATPVASGVRENLVGPFWQPRGDDPAALFLRGPGEKVYTV
jgi:hypothetical protein